MTPLKKRTQRKTNEVKAWALVNERGNLQFFTFSTYREATLEHKSHYPNLCGKSKVVRIVIKVEPS